MRVSPRVLAVVLLPALAVLALGMPLLWGSLEGVAERVATDYLTVTLSVVTPMVAARIDGPATELQRWVEEMARHEALRLTLIDRDGLVLADSSRNRVQVESMDNHARRPEIVDAARTGRGVSVRYSTTVGIDFVYVAETLTLPDGRLYFIRLAEPLSELAAVTERMTRIVWIALVVSLVLIGVVTVWLDSHLYRPLRELAAGADRMARGELTERIPVPADEVLARVGRSLNQLARRVEEQVAAVEAERSHLEVVGASMSEGILVTDAEGRALLANPSFRKLFRVRGEVVGRSATELTLMPEIDDMIRATLGSGETRSRQLDILQPRRRWLAVTSSLLADATGVVVAARDISDVVHLGQARRDLVANVSHELKTPLAAIRGYAETLQDGALDDPEANRRFVERILQQCRRLQSLLDDLLTLSRLESAQRHLEPEPQDLGEVLRTTLDILGPAARAKEVEVGLEVEGELTLDASREVLEELFVNLVDNAIKYNRRGGTVLVRAWREGDRIVAEVRDTGRGIPESAIPRLFERFYRVDRGRGRQEGGTGLGLAIVKHAVKVHGGDVRVQTELGKGTTFRVELPVRPAWPAA